VRGALLHLSDPASGDGALRWAERGVWGALLHLSDPASNPVGFTPRVVRCEGLRALRAAGPLKGSGSGGPSGWRSFDQPGRGGLTVRDDNPCLPAGGARPGGELGRAERDTAAQQ